MEPIHSAAYDGDLAALNRLIEEDGRRLDAQIHERVIMDGYNNVKGCTPLMLAAYKGHDAVVARLIELGADLELRDVYWYAATHWACEGKHSSTLAPLLDAGALMNARCNDGVTHLMIAACNDTTDCVKLLLARGGETLELDAQDSGWWTALHYTADAEITQLLLHAGADPTIRDNQGRTPLDLARQRSRLSCIPILQAAMAEPQRPRLLLKARALAHHRAVIPQIRADARGKGLPRAVRQKKAMAAAPAYLKKRVAKGRELPEVSVCVEEEEDDEEKLVACVKYVLGLEDGGGMLEELFIELCELLVPKWDRKNV